MTTRIRNESSKYYAFSLRAVGDDYTPTEADLTAHRYSMRQDEELRADVREDKVRTFIKQHFYKDSEDHVTVWYTTEQEWTSRMAYPALGISDRSTAWQQAIARGMSPAKQFTVLDTKLVKKVAGEMIDPTMYLKELDSNFGMVARRMMQAWEFLRNLKNPRKLARLTMRYFRGSETRRSLVRRYRRARSQFALRSRRWRSVKVSDAWLEYQFGWRPLIEDTVNLIKLAQNTAIRLKTYRVGVKILNMVNKYDMVGGPISANDKQLNRYYIEDETGGHARINFRITNPMLRSLASMALPVYSVWDSIPFSFLADMATNVGDHLKYVGYHWGLSLQKGNNYRVAYRNLYAKLEVGSKDIWSPSSGVIPNTRTNYVQLGSIYRRTIQTERQVINDWPSLPWIDKTPQILDNTGQIITIGALVHQWLSKAASRRFWNEML